MSIYSEVNFLEENLLVSMAKGGDSNALTDLIKRYSETVLQKSLSVKKISGIENEDLYQEGMLGLLSAVYSFDESKGVLFSTYATTLITRKMLSALRTANKKSNLPLDSYVSIDEKCDIRSFSPTPEELLMFNEEIDSIISFVNNNLSKTEKKVFRLNLLGLSYNEIAEILDCTEKSVDNALQRIRKKIRSIK